SMFNADGSEAEMCGNGIRCFVKYAVDRGIVPNSGASVSVETLAGIRQVAPIKEDGSVTGARVSMGLPILTPADVPVKLESAGEYGAGPVLKYPFLMDGYDLPLSFVSMGNPHAVTFIDTAVAEFPLHTVGPKIEHHSIFPNRVNFEIVNVDSPNHLTARVWERGSGETLACGTGACGIAVASILTGHSGNTVDITLPGGTLKVDWDGQGEVFLEGPAQEVFSGEWA
ncbi:MAG: diaminopimelate epimerase, partial [Chloroflexota bacterium]|nr:diaminopimelate epimerase [Chloroflexota bacterium]